MKSVKYVILVDDKGYYVNMGKRGIKVTYADNPAEAKVFVTEGFAEDVAHKVWLAGHGDYVIHDLLTAMREWVAAQDKPTQFDDIDAMVDELVSLGCQHVFITYKVNHRTVKWWVTILDKDLFQYTKGSNLLAEALLKCVKVLKENGQ